MTGLTDGVQEQWVSIADPVVWEEGSRGVRAIEPVSPLMPSADAAVLMPPGKNDAFLF